MKTIRTKGITFIEPVPGGTSEWYRGSSMDHGDLYEAEEIFYSGGRVRGNDLCLIHYPDGGVFFPVPREQGTYAAEPVFYENAIYFIHVDFNASLIRICRFDCENHETAPAVSLPLKSVKDCYNLRLFVSPLTLTRQGPEHFFEIIWPECSRFEIDSHESFFLREGDRLYFAKWYEEGEGQDYRYWEETVIRDLHGRVVGTLPGDLRMMPNGEIWHLY